MPHLTQRCYFLALIVVISGIAGQWSDLVFQDLWRIPAALLIMVLTIEWLLLLKQPIHIERHVADRAPLGRELYGTLYIKNETTSRLQVQALQTPGEGLAGNKKILVWDLLPDESRAQQFCVIPQTLGELQWGTIYTRRLGFFGFAWWGGKVQIVEKLQVVPDHLSYKEKRSGTTHIGERTLRPSGSGLELFGLRDYQPGDPLRIIDWKATARTKKRTVRILMKEQHLELMLMIDVGRHTSLHTGRLSRLHHVVNVASRLAERALNNGDRVGLLTYANNPLIKIKPAANLTNLKKIRDVLTVIESQAIESNPLPAMSEALSLLSHRAMIIIFTDLGNEDTDGQLLRAIELASSKHLPLVAGIVDQELIELKDKQAKQWLDPYYALASVETLNMIQKNITHLRRLGSQIVCTRSNLLDKTILNTYEELRMNSRV